MIVQDRSTLSNERRILFIDTYTISQEIHGLLLRIYIHRENDIVFILILIKFCFVINIIQVNDKIMKNNN